MATTNLASRWFLTGILLVAAASCTSSSPTPAPAPSTTGDGGGAPAAAKDGGDTEKVPPVERPSGW